MKKSYLTLIILGLTLVVFAFWRQGQEEGNSDQNAMTQQRWSAPETPKADPSADNVSQGYFQQVKQLKEYLNTHPQDTTHILRLARLYQDGHQPELAVNYYEQYLRVRPDHMQSWLDLANCYGMLKNWSKAMYATRTALRKHPQQISARYNLGAIYANLGKMDSARVVWQAVAADDSDPHVQQMAQQSLARLE
jgi:tetratricopeptide (TPR) repeat protein